MMVELCDAKVKQEAVLTYEHILYLKLDFLHVGGGHLGRTGLQQHNGLMLANTALKTSQQ